MAVTTLLWRRLDGPGHDACRLDRHERGLEISGTAVFKHGDGSACLTYHMECDDALRTRHARLRGFVGATVVEVHVERSADGMWHMDGAPVAGLESCVHLDFGFTPATNYQQLRYLNLSIGQAADCPVAWLDVPPSGLRVLPQRYDRWRDAAYWYEARTVGYAGLLETTPDGFVARYPGLWELEV